MAERSRRIDSTHPEFQRLWEIVHMICWAHNPHLFVHAPDESGEGGSFELDLDEPERLALIEILKEEMKNLLTEMRNSGGSELADEIDAALENGPFGEAVNGLRIILTDFDFVPTKPVSEEEARKRDEAQPNIITLRELVGDLNLTHWRWVC